MCAKHDFLPWACPQFDSQQICHCVRGQQKCLFGSKILCYMRQKLIACGVIKKRVIAQFSLEHCFSHGLRSLAGGFVGEINRILRCIFLHDLYILIYGINACTMISWIPFIIILWQQTLQYSVQMLESISLQDLTKIGTSLSLFIIVYSGAKRVLKTLSQMDFIHEQKLQKPSQVHQLKEGESMLLKAQFKSSNFLYSQQQNIFYNQYYLVQPSDTTYVNSLAHDVVAKQRKNLKFQIAGIDGETQRFRGVGQVLGDIFDVRKGSVQIDKGGLVKRFIGGICWVIEWIFERSRWQINQQPLNPQHHKRTPFIYGPQIGTMQLFSCFMKNMFFVFQCKLQNGNYKIQVIAESKNAILASLEQALLRQCFCYMAWSMLTAAYCCYIYSDVKRIAYRIKSKMQINYTALTLQQVPDEKACLICYTKARNIILLKCKHLIVCVDCSHGLVNDACPICKEKITQTKIIHNAFAKSASAAE